MVVSRLLLLFFFSSRRRHTRSKRDWSSDVCSSDLSGRLLCRSAAEPATFSIHKEIEGDAAGRVPDDAEFTVRWTVNAGPNAGLSGDLVVRADGTVVDGPELAAGAEVSFEETARPSVSGAEWEGVPIDPSSITLDSSAPVVDV